MRNLCDTFCYLIAILILTGNNSAAAKHDSGCSVCGDGKEVGNLDAIIEFYEQNGISCEDLQYAAANGEIDEVQCQLFESIVAETCECIQISGSLQQVEYPVSPTILSPTTPAKTRQHTDATLDPPTWDMKDSPKISPIDSPMESWLSISPAETPTFSHPSGLWVANQEHYDTPVASPVSEPTTCIHGFFNELDKCMHCDILKGPDDCNSLDSESEISRCLSTCFLPCSSEESEPCPEDLFCSTTNGNSSGYCRSCGRVKFPFDCSIAETYFSKEALDYISEEASDFSKNNCLSACFATCSETNPCSNGSVCAAYDTGSYCRECVKVDGTCQFGDITDGAITYWADPTAYSPLGDVDGRLVECNVDDLENECEMSTGRTICMITGGKYLSDFEKIKNCIEKGGTGAIIVSANVTDLFKITSQDAHATVDHEALCKAEFGENARVADWEYDVKFSLNDKEVEELIKHSGINRLSMFVTNASENVTEMSYYILKPTRGIGTHAGLRLKSESTGKVLCTMQAVNNSSIKDMFNITSQMTYVLADHEALCKEEFGENARVTDWMYDIKTLSSSEREIVENYFNLSWVSSYFFVTNEGRTFDKLNGTYSLRSYTPQNNIFNLTQCLNYKYLDFLEDCLDFGDGIFALESFSAAMRKVLCTFGKPGNLSIISEIPSVTLNSGSKIESDFRAKIGTNVRLSVYDYSREQCSESEPCGYGKFCDYKLSTYGFCSDCSQVDNCFFSALNKNGTIDCAKSCGKSLSFNNCKFCPGTIDLDSFDSARSEEEQCEFCPNNDMIYQDRIFRRFGEDITCSDMSFYIKTVNIDKRSLNCKLAQSFSYACGCSGVGYVGADTESKKILLAWLPRVMAIFSILGSIITIGDILSSKKRRHSTFGTLLIALSTFDLLGSIAYSLTTLPLPKDDYIFDSQGNMNTCRAQGFFIQLGTTAAYYNVSIAVYYLLILKYSWSEGKINKYKIWLFVIPLIFGLSFAIAGIFYYDNMFLWCNNEANYWPEIPMIIAIAVATAIMGIICWHVYKEETVSLRWRKGKDSKRRNLTTQVCWQSIHYLLAFYAVWPPYLILQFLWSTGQALGLYWFILLAGSLVPLQGFWNCVTNLRRKKKRKKKVTSGLLSKIESIRVKFVKVVSQWNCCSSGISEDIVVKTSKGDGYSENEVQKTVKDSEMNSDTNMDEVSGILLSREESTGRNKVSSSCQATTTVVIKRENCKGSALETHHELFCSVRGGNVLVGDNGEISS